MRPPRVTVRPRDLPREFVVIVGGPSLTFNGYTMLSPLNDEEVPMPKPTSLSMVEFYIGPIFGSSNPLFIGTHDLYWGNFIEPVHRLFKRRIIQPDPGDIVTVLIYLPPYRTRLAFDWEASPHNPKWFDKSPWVKRRRPYDPLDQEGRAGSAPRGAPWPADQGRVRSHAWPRPDPPRHPARRH